MWIVYSPLVAFIVNLCLLAFLLQFVSEGYDVWDRLYVASDQAVSHDMALLNRGKKKMGQLDGGAGQRANTDPRVDNVSRTLSREEQHEAAMRNMSEEEYLQFKEFKLQKELEKR